MSDSNTQYSLVYDRSSTKHQTDVLSDVNIKLGGLRHIDEDCNEVNAIHTKCLYDMNILPSSNGDIFTHVSQSL